MHKKPELSKCNAEKKELSILVGSVRKGRRNWCFSFFKIIKFFFIKI